MRNGLRTAATQFLKTIKLRAILIMTADLKPYRAGDIEAALSDIRHAFEADPPIESSHSGLQLHSSPTSLQMLALCKLSLDGVVGEQSSLGVEHPAIWLTDVEKNGLSKAILDQHIDEIWQVASALITEQPTRICKIRLEAYDEKKQKEIEKQSSIIPTSVSDPALLNSIKDALSLDPLGEELLWFARENDINILLQRRDGQAATVIYREAEDEDASNIYLINAEPGNVGNSAAFLGHALRHRQRERDFHKFFEENKRDADILLRARLLKADAFALQQSIEFFLGDKGVPMVQYPMTKSFKEMCLGRGWNSPESRHALDSVISEFFSYYVTPSSSLDIYERDCIPQIERMRI
jgi:hypothetical protein